MKAGNWIKIVTVLVGVIVSLNISSAADAFSVSPTKYVITMDPGTARKLIVEVVNSETEPIFIKTSVIGAKQTTEGRMVFEKGSDAAESWFGQLEEARIAPNAKHAFSYELTVPAGVAPGSHYIGLVSESVPQLANSDMTVRGQLVVVTAIQVAGIAREELSATIKAEKRLVVDAKSLAVTLNLDNIGNIEVPLVGTMRVKYPWANNFAEIKMGLGSELFAQTSRRLDYLVELPDPWFGFMGSKTAQLASVAMPKQLVANFSSLFRWPGKYLIEVSIVYGKTSQITTRTFSLWYFPWWSIVGGIFVLFIFITGYHYLRRLFGRYYTLR